MAHQVGRGLRRALPLGRAALAVLVLVSFVSVQTASGIHPHEHGESHTHCCPACHAGHSPAVCAIAVVKIVAPTLYEWRARCENQRQPGASLTPFHSSRAPPA